MLVATKAKLNQDPESPLNREFFKSFLEVIKFNKIPVPFKFFENLSS